jgi:thiol-disulfide isomerase/thioredoxin
MPNVGGRLAPSLRRLLDAEGRHNLAHPEASWSSRQVLQDLDWLRGTSPPAGPPSDLAQTTPARSLAGLAGSPTPLSKLHQQAGALLGWSSALRARIRSLHDYPIVINVWASWCSPCREEFPLFAAASAAFGRRVAFLGVNVEDQSAAAQSFLTDHPVSYPSYQSSTGELSGLAQIEGTPTTIYLSPGGHLSFVHTGEYGNLQTLEADIGRYALAAPAVRTATMPRTPER